MRWDGQLFWEGPVEGSHSYASVNRELISALRARGVRVTTLPPGRSQGPRAGSLTSGKLAYVRHMWPPDFTRPPGFTGRFIVMQPWEYGYLPRNWVEPIKTNVDEIWTYSTFVREAYIRSGIDPEKVFVVPCGFNPKVFNCNVPPRPLPTGRSFRFLFVGGAATSRKGFDVLLDAFVREFSDEDDVCLVVKDYFYGPVEDMIIRARKRPHCPEIVYIYADLPPEGIAGLYAGVQCYVHPYRAEGFGLPILEAMACGLPVIVTGFGSALDFASSEFAYFVPARVTEFAEDAVGDIHTIGRPFWAEPDARELARLMRYVFEHRDEARAKGARAAREAASRHTWGHVAERVVWRLLSK